MEIVKIAQEEEVEVNNEKNIVVDDLTDDEEFRGEVRDLAKGENKLQLKDFDPDESFFSEDEEEVKKDDVIQNQKETHAFRLNKGSFMTEMENYLMHSGFEERETKKADQLYLGPIDSKISRRMYNPKEIM